MADQPWIAELERQLAADPSSIAFAQLAEEYRRLGRFEDAVRVCRDGLRRAPAFPSARLTLARALVALGQRGEAEMELATVAAEGTDHVAGRRALAELRRLRGETDHPTPEQSDDVLAARELEAWLADVTADRMERLRRRESQQASPSTI